MGIEILQTILDEIGKQELFPGASLNPNKNGTCIIPLPGDGNLMFELDGREEHLIVVSILGTVTPGRYRESLFKEALKANGLPYPREGTIAYSSKTEHLLLFEKMHLPGLTGGMVVTYLPKFLEKADLWRQAVSTGAVPSVVDTQSGLGLQSLLGLR